MLQEALALKEKEMIAVVGGGGKTSIIFALAEELRGLGKRVLITTTTKIYAPRNGGKLVLLGDREEPVPKASSILQQEILVVGKTILPDNKVEGLRKEVLDVFYDRASADYILVEADGAKGKPIKLPARYEPVIPGKTTLVVGVIGLDALGKPLTDKYFHRADIAYSQLGYPQGSIINEEVIVSVVKWDKGLFKGVPGDAGKVLIINKVDGEEQLYKARGIFNKLMSGQGEGEIMPDRVILTSMFRKDPVVEVLP